MTETTPDDSHPFDRATRVTASAGRWRGETCDEYFAFVGPSAAPPRRRCCARS